MRLVVEDYQMREEVFSQDLTGNAHATRFQRVYVDLGDGRKLRITATVGGGVELYTEGCGITVEPVASNMVIIYPRKYEHEEVLDAAAEGRKL